MLKFFKKNKGFTLIELLVVIAIISVLASIVLVSLNTARVKGRDARRLADIKSIQNALELYYDGVGAGNYVIGTYSALSAALTPNYIPAIPQDPSGGTVTYFYAASSATTPSSYHLGAIMEGISASQGALATDADFDSNVWTGITGVFPGIDANCAGSSGSGVDQCYDVKN